MFRKGIMKVKRDLAVVLSAAMVLSSFSVPVMAAEEPTEEVVVEAGAEEIVSAGEEDVDGEELNTLADDELVLNFGEFDDLSVNLEEKVVSTYEINNVFKLFSAYNTTTGKKLSVKREGKDSSAAYVADVTAAVKEQYSLPNV